MKSIIVFWIILFLTPIVQSDTWSVSTTLQDGTMIYGTVTTGNLTVNEEYQCRCKFEINWVIEDGEGPINFGHDSTWITIDKIIFTSHPTEYPDGASWITAIEEITIGQIQEAVKSHLQQVVEAINRMKHIEPEIIYEIDLSD